MKLNLEVKYPMIHKAWEKDGTCRGQLRSKTQGGSPDGGVLAGRQRTLRTRLKFSSVQCRANERNL